jgi:hypothetical protein
MTISTTPDSASLVPQKPRRAFFASSYALWLTLPALALLDSQRRKKHARLKLRSRLLGLFLLALVLTSCGGGGSNGGAGGGGGGQQQGTSPGTYTITVTGTSGSLSHAAPSTVTLVVTQ